MLNRGAYSRKYGIFIRGCHMTVTNFFKVFCQIFWTIICLRCIFQSFTCSLGLVQTSNFSCAESNVNELEQRMQMIALDSAHEKFDV